MQKKRLFIDMDGTLAVFTPTKNIETLYEKGYFASREPMSNVIMAVKTLHSSESDMEIYLLSAVLTDSKYALQEKNEWLDRFLPQIDKEHRIFTICGEEKSQYIKGEITKEDYLLDDYTKNLTQWEQRGGTGIKIFNGINHTKRTWNGSVISSFRQPMFLADCVLAAMNGANIRDIHPIEGERKFVSGNYTSKFPKNKGEIRQQWQIESEGFEP